MESYSFLISSLHTSSFIFLPWPSSPCRCWKVTRQRHSCLTPMFTGKKLDMPLHPQHTHLTALSIPEYKPLDQWFPKIFWISATWRSHTIATYHLVPENTFRSDINLFIIITYKWTNNKEHESFITSYYEESNCFSTNFLMHGITLFTAHKKSCLGAARWFLLFYCTGLKTLCLHSLVEGRNSS